LSSCGQLQEGARARDCGLGQKATTRGRARRRRRESEWVIWWFTCRLNCWTV